MSHSSRRALLSALLLGAAFGLGCGDLNKGPRGVRGPGAEVKEAFPGQVVQLYAEVVDDEGDPLTYAWTQESPAEPVGTFSDTTVPSPTWTAPAVSEETSFRLQLRVDDDDGNALEGSTNVLVRPRLPASHAPGASR